MRAWQFSNTNKPLETNLQLVEDAPQPSKPLAATEILLEDISVGLNPADYLFAEMGLLGKAIFHLPSIPGMDYSGRIVAVGSGVDSIKPGNLTNYQGCVLLPPDVDLDQAAGVGTAGQTVYSTIVSYVNKGDRIFINGGAGGVGTFGIQFAKAMGCHVTVSCSTTKMALCKELGADEVIDYKTTDLISRLRGEGKMFNLMVDLVCTSPPNLFKTANDFLVSGSKFIFVGAVNMFLPSILRGGKNKFKLFFANCKVEELKTGTATGKIVIHVGEKPF
ncbi:putative oxidoreductase [Cadophora sp. MPI-SDFR-AT-0126]|nr:putative oxidoreductase [Leotiomycetes sp. MPI-SDFR-AT-0126]